MICQLGRRDTFVHEAAAEFLGPNKNLLLTIEMFFLEQELHK